MSGPTSSGAAPPRGERHACGSFSSGPGLPGPDYDGVVAFSGVDHVAEARLGDFLALASDLDLDGVLRRTVDVAASWTGGGQVVLAVGEEGRSATRYVTHGIPEGTSPRSLSERHDDGVIRAPIEAVGAPLGTLVVALPDSEPREEHRRWLDRLARVAGVAIRNARTFSLSERRREWVEATAVVTESLHPPYALAEPVQRVAEGAQRIARASLAAVVRAGEAGYDVAAAVSAHDHALPALLDELRPAIQAAQTTGEPFAAPHARVGTVVGVPLNPELAFEGVVLVVTDHGAGRLPADDHELLDSFVTHGSLVLDRAVLLQERQQAVVAADRDRIARDLHDVVIQRLFATGLKLQASRHATELGMHPGHVEEVVRDLDVTIRDIRSTIFDLEHGREASLRAGVAALAREYEAALGFLPDVRTWGPLNSLVGGSLAEQALVVLREALSNCVRHAAAEHCTVEVSVESGWLTLEVVDDGRGPGDLDLRQGTQRGGVRNLQRRAEALGGELIVALAQPQGTRLTWRVPVVGQ